MNNYDSIPIDTRNVATDTLSPDNKCKNALGRLWKLYLRVNTYDTEYAEQDLQNFLQELYHMGNHSQESMLNTINQKIDDIQREEGIIAFGLKKRKTTGKKRKRTTKKTTKKRSNKRSKRKY